MREYIVATGNQLTRLRQTGKDHYEECHGQVQKTFCTPEYLRERLREFFLEHQSKDPNPYVAIHTWAPITVMFNLKIIGWLSATETKKESIHCSCNGEPVLFEVSNIRAFQILP